MIIDCVDPERLAAFWSKLVGREAGRPIGPYVFLQKLPDDVVGLGFQRVDGAKSDKNRVHPDLGCDDVKATAERVEELGGRRVPGFERGGFLVMADPEGNEFCLLPKDSAVGLDEEGNAHYLDESD